MDDVVCKEDEDDDEMKKRSDKCVQIMQMLIDVDKEENSSLAAVATVLSATR